MQTLAAWILYYLGRFVASLRYRLKVVGLERLDALRGGAGVLVMPNHAALVDPLLVTVGLWPKVRIRPLAVEFIYSTPILHGILRTLRAVPIPTMEMGGNPIKVRRLQRALNAVVEGLSRGDAFMVYPAGELKSSGREVIARASGVHTLLSQTEAQVVLVRTLGLWGSSFSRGPTGQSPSFLDALSQTLGALVKNCIFFTPRRTVTIEVELAPPDFPRGADRATLNRWLEEWYNRGLGPEGEPLTLVSYSRWRPEYAKVLPRMEAASYADLSHFPEDVRRTVLEEIGRLARRPPDQLTGQMHLALDLGLDSLDIAELSHFLAIKYQIRSVTPGRLETVGRVVAAASGELAGLQSEEVVKGPLIATNRPRRPPPRLLEGDTIGQLFLRQCERMGSAIACGDATSGPLSYRQLKWRVLMLADWLRTVPGNRVAILLPASVAAMVSILAAIIARKTPVMVNWTSGRVMLDRVATLPNLGPFITSRQFLDRLDGFDMSESLEKRLIFLEEARFELGLWRKVSTLMLAQLPAAALERHLGLFETRPESEAVVLYTSGTEAQPKAVPLTHANLLSNGRAGLECVSFSSDDRILSFLPPFHSFGFTVTGLVPLLAGLKAIFAPDPLNGRGLACQIAASQATVLCAAPTFLDSILRAAKPEQLQSLRLIVLGAERPPPSLIDQVHQLIPGAQILNGYGITECSPIVTLQRPGEPSEGVGRPLPGVELLVVHPETLAPLPIGQNGLILIRGPGVFNGYLEGRSPFVDVEGKRWYNSGDLGLVDSRGALHLSGRLKRFVKIGGEMVSLAAIEAAVLERLRQRDPAVEPSAAAVIAQEVEGRPDLILFTSHEISLDEANEAVRSGGVSNLARLAGVRRLQPMPITSTGKIDYRGLTQLLSQVPGG